MMVLAILAFHVFVSVHLMACNYAIVENGGSLLQEYFEIRIKKSRPDAFYLSFLFALFVLFFISYYFLLVG